MESTFNYVFWFRSPYELGLDLALPTFLGIIIVIELLINHFADLIIEVQKKYSIKNLSELNRFFSIYYIKRLLILFMVGIMIIIITYYSISWLKRFDYISELRAFYASPITLFTFCISAVAYLFLAIGLFNGLLFLTLSKTELLLKSMIPSLVLNFVIGFTLSRLVSYEYGVIGLISGSILFIILSTKFAYRVFSNMDYYYYAGF